MAKQRVTVVLDAGEMGPESVYTAIRGKKKHAITKLANEYYSEHLEERKSGEKPITKGSMTAYVKRQYTFVEINLE